MNAAADRASDSGSVAANERCEHFVTLFDASFLPIGLALYGSLKEHARPFRLWVLAIDEEAERHLVRLALPDVTVIPLREFETPALLAVKPGRTRAEYCWTMTPFTCQAVFDRDPSAMRATYVDADVFFFRDPRVLLKELDDSHKHVLITEHAYAPEYDRSHDSGRFCVQFLTFDRSQAAGEVMRWWQERCVEWCFARYEDGKFGDQVYLDQWPALFGDRVHIVRQVEKTLAPWNVRHFSKDARPGSGDVSLPRVAAAAAAAGAALQVLRRRRGGPTHLPPIPRRFGQIVLRSSIGRKSKCRLTFYPANASGGSKV